MAHRSSIREIMLKAKKWIQHAWTVLALSGIFAPYLFIVAVSGSTAFFIAYHTWRVCFGGP
jgi:hypothetical protein